MLCRRFNCLPSQLDDEDGVRLLNIVYVENLAQAFERQRKNQATADDNKLIGPILIAEAARSRT